MRSALFVLLTVLFASIANGQSDLRGSSELAILQNIWANNENLSRMQDGEAIKRMRKNGYLVPIPNGKFGLVVDSRLEESRRFARPWTIKFFKDLGTRVEKKIGKPLQVNSCVRDAITQEDLGDSNGNAGPTQGPKASSHLTGATCDISRLGLTKKEQDFIRSRLRVNKAAGYIIAIEEKKQAVWHIMVSRTYVAGKSLPTKKPVKK